MDEREGIYNFITYEMKEEILLSMGEFGIHIIYSDDMEKVFFTRNKHKFDCYAGLWGSDPMLDNIRFVCEEMMRVEYEGSETQRLCNDLVRKYERSKLSYPKIESEHKRIKLQ